MGLLKGILIISIDSQNNMRVCSKYGVELINRDIAVNPAQLGVVDGLPLETKTRWRALCRRSFCHMEISPRHPRDTNHLWRPESGAYETWTCLLEHSIREAQDIHAYKVRLNAVGADISYHPFAQ